jgi:drug/metabolite transporter (DMT)-like permease
MDNEQKGSAYVMISGLLYGLIGYLGMNIIHNNISINNMLFWRFLVASLVIGILFFIKKNSYKIDLKKMSKAFVYGAIFYSGSAAFYFYAATYIGTGLAMTIFFVYPPIIILYNWVKYQQKINRIYFTTIIFTLMGMLLLIDKDELAFDLFGMILAIMSAISYAAYIICSKNQLENLSPLISTLMVSIGSCTFFLSMSFLSGQLIIPAADVWPGIIAIGIICTALLILLLLEGLKYISSAKAAILSVLEPVTVVIFGILLLDEELSFLQFLGVIIMLSSAIIIQLDKLKPTKDSLTASSTT